LHNSRKSAQGPSNRTFNVAKISGNTGPNMAINDEQNINLLINSSGGGNSDLNCVEVPGSPIDRF
jgi:hypothetical protein